jgi:hypothetical protein
VTSKWKAYKEKLGETRPWDMLNPNTEYVPEEEAERRYDICKACPELIDLTKQCKQCGCFMAMKTKVSKATCPLGKW